MMRTKQQQQQQQHPTQQQQQQQQQQEDDEDSKPSAVVTSTILPSTTAPSAAPVAPVVAPVVTQRTSRLQVHIKRFHAVAQWSWNANDDVCGICQTAFEGTAPGVKFPGEDCPVVWGKCGHAFHLQCVSKWLQQPSSKNSCPICRQSWYVLFYRMIAIMTNSVLPLLAAPN
jgi:anaphase-promoting complex subunit 11